MFFGVTVLLYFIKILSGSHNIELVAEINAATCNSEGLQSPIKLTCPRGCHPHWKAPRTCMHGFSLPQIILVYCQKVIITKNYEMRLQQVTEGKK